MKRCVIKRPEHSSSIKDETKQDIIRKLPDTLLTHIISLLPDADACRTSILSKRWRDLWMFLPNLRFVMPLCQTKEQVDKFYALVDKTLAIHDGTGMSIQKFLLSCSAGFDYDRVHYWLCLVVLCKVEILVLKFPDYVRYHIHTVSFCWDFFKLCNMLVELTLEGDFTLNVPKADVLFPRLKKISLIHTMCLSGNSLINLITGCPVLEELSVEGHEPTLNLTKLKEDSSQSLQRLKICSRRTSKFEVVIHEYRYMHDYCVFPTHILAKPLSFVEILDKTIYPSRSSLFHNFFHKFAEAKILTLTNSSLEALVFQGLDEYILSNVVKLMIDNISTWNSLLVLLNSVPNLEHITFSDGISHDKVSWIPPMEPPACLHLKMKEIIILNRKTVNHDEFGFVRFLLKYSKNLERLRINACVLDPMRHEQLQKFHRGLCRIEIV